MRWENVKTSVRKPSWIGVNLSRWRDFSRTLRRLHDLIHPDEIPVDPHQLDPEPPQDILLTGVRPEYRQMHINTSQLQQGRTGHAFEETDTDHAPPGDFDWDNMPHVDTQQVQNAEDLQHEAQVQHRDTRELGRKESGEELHEWTRGSSTPKVVLSRADTSTMVDVDM